MPLGVPPGERPPLHLLKSGGATDRELIDAMRRGDAKLADAFTRRVWPVVVSTVRRLLGGHDAEFDDLCQLAVIEVLGSVKRYRGDGALDGWVRMVASHLVYKHLRRKGVERRLFTALESAETEQARTAGPSQVYRRKDAIGRVLKHLEAIDQDRAIAWALHDVLGYDVKELAVITSVSEAAAQTRLSRGRRELHARLDEDPVIAELLHELGGDQP